MAAGIWRRILLARHRKILPSRGTRRSWINESLVAYTVPAVKVLTCGSLSYGMPHPGTFSSQANVLNWLHSLLPHVPHYGYVLVFIVVFLNNIGLPLPGEAILLGAGFILGRTTGSLLLPEVAGTLASFMGGIFAFWLGRRLGGSGLQRIRWLLMGWGRTGHFLRDG